MEFLGGGGSAVAQATADILRVTLLCHRISGLLAGTTHDAIPEEAKNITMTLLDRPQSRCQIQY